MVRFQIQLAIEDNLIGATEESNSHLLMVSAVLAGYTYPDEMSEVIKVKRVAENDISVAINERDGNITDAETSWLVSKQEAEKIRIQGEAEVDSLLAEAEAYADAVRYRFELIQGIFARQKEIFGMTATEFIDGWLTAYVLLNSTSPVTTTLFDDVNISYTTPTPTDMPIDVNMTGVPIDVLTTMDPMMTTNYFTTT